MGIVESQRGESYGVVHSFWNAMSKQNWDELKTLLSESFEASWPQSREIMDAHGFIEVNKNYPGTHKIEVADMKHEYDNWDHSSNVVTQTYIESQMPDGKLIQLYAISFFEVMDEGDGPKILSLLEYWANTYPAPEWRKQWTTICDRRIM